MEKINYDDDIIICTTGFKLNRFGHNTFAKLVLRLHRKLVGCTWSSIFEKVLVLLSRTNDQLLVTLISETILLSVEENELHWVATTKTRNPRQFDVDNDRKVCLQLVSWH